MSRSRTRGTAPSVAESVSSTPPEPSDIVAPTSPPRPTLRASPFRPAPSRQRGQRPSGARAGRSEPQSGQVRASAIVGASVAEGGRVRHVLITGRGAGTIQAARRFHAPRAAKRAFSSSSTSASSATVAAIAARRASRYRFRSRWTATCTAASVVPSRRGQLRLRHGPPPAGQHPLQHVEGGPSARPLVLGAEPGEHALEQGQRPVALEEPLGRLAVRRLPPVSPLGVDAVDRERRPPAAAPRGPVALALVGQEVAAIRHQERAEPPPRRVGRGDRPPFEQAGEVALRQVERPLGVIPLAPDEGVDGEPVGGAELGQGLAVAGLAGGGDAAPAGRGERGPGGRDGGRVGHGASSRSRRRWRRLAPAQAMPCGPGRPALRRGDGPISGPRPARARRGSLARDAIRDGKPVVRRACELLPRARRSAIRMALRFPQGPAREQDRKISAFRL